jgi:imidazole glycerol-phosphate synthase subunit HisH
MRVTIFDYGAGNLHSLAKAIMLASVDLTIEPDPVRAIETDLLVLPGVGAFGPAAARLAPGRKEMRDAIDAGLPTFGICLGMQLLFDGSDEGAGPGLGVFPGRVTRLEAMRSPQIGWNTLDEITDSATKASSLSSVYYANRYACRPASESNVLAWSTHERDRFPAIVRRERTIGVQFHPEKSSAPGVAFIRAVIEEACR